MKKLIFLIGFLAVTLTSFSQTVRTRTYFSDLFITGYKPTQTNYRDLWASVLFWNQDTLAATQIVGVDEISNDPTLADSSARAIPTEAAVKAYVDAQVGGGGGGGGGGATDLGYTANPTNGFISSSTGAGTTIPQATPSNINQVGGASGLVSNADKYRIDNAVLMVQGSNGVAAAVSTGTNPIVKTVGVSLSPAAANTVKANSTASSAIPTDVAIGASQLFGRGSTGNIAPISLGANLTMTGTTLSATGSGGATDLGYIASPTNGTVTSTTGGSATIPVVNGTNAGLATPSIFTNSHAAATVTDGPLVDFTLTGQNISATIPTNSVDNTIVSDMPGNTVKVNNTSSTGDPVDIALSASQLLGRGASGNVAPIVLGTNLSMSGTTLNATGGGSSISYDALTSSAVTALVTRIGSSAVTITNPGSGQYNLVVPSGTDLQRADVFFNNTVLDGSNQFIIRIDNSANSRARRANVQLLLANTGSLVDQHATSTNHTLVVSGNITTITIPGANGNGSAGFQLLLN